MRRRSPQSGPPGELFVRAGGYTDFWQYHQTVTPPPAPVDYTFGFERFWEVYPRSIGKKAAFKAWMAQQRKGWDAAMLLTAAINYAAIVAVKDVEFIMHPSTFLGPSDRWQDYVNPPAHAPRMRLTRAASSLLQWADREEVKDDEAGSAGTPGDDGS